MRNGIRVVIADYTSVKGEGKGQQTGELKRTFRSYQQIADASFHLRLSGIIPFFDQDRRSDHRSFICEALFTSLKLAMMTSTLIIRRCCVAIEEPPPRCIRSGSFKDENLHSQALF
jgi:hypothetical protein